MAELPQQGSELRDVSAVRKPYSPPTVTLLGNLSDLTLGMNGSNFDQGQGTFTKRGQG